MTYLIDTHVLIWWWDEREKLSARALDILADRSQDIFVSAATGWEMAIKVRKGQLPKMRDRISVYDTDVMADGFRHLAIDHRHGVRAGGFNEPHSDPFDRVIAAQALIEDLTVVTRDKAIAGFGCKVLW